MKIENDENKYENKIYKCIIEKKYKGFITRIISYEYYVLQIRSTKIIVIDVFIELHTHISM